MCVCVCVIFNDNAFEKKKICLSKIVVFLVTLPKQNSSLYFLNDGFCVELQGMISSLIYFLRALIDICLPILFLFLCLWYSIKEKVYRCLCRFFIFHSFIRR